MSTGSILSILVYPQYGYHLVCHTGLSLVHCSYISVGSLQADDGEERARALLISSGASGRHSLNGSRMVSVNPAGAPGKKWSRSALLSSGGVEAPERSGKRRGGRPTVNLLAVHTVWGVAEAKNSVRYGAPFLTNGAPRAGY